MQESVSPWVVRVTGGILFLFGAFIAPFSIFPLFTSFIIPMPDEHFLLTFVFSLVAIFCLVVGGRMIVNRPNTHGSLLSPVGWYVLATVFLVLGAAVVFSGDSSMTGKNIGGVVSCITFANWCFFCGRRHSLKK
jgi:hypothetical protein